MQHVACPGCGAAVQFTSAASVMAVCSYCQTTVLKDADSVRDLGKMGVVLEDYSPIQIATSGAFGGRQFNVVGRLQLRYPAGFWNEWYVLFDDGQSGWLSDASGQFTMTVEKAAPAGLPAFEALKAGQTLTLAGHVYTASDVRTATCTAGQGELPFQVGAGWQARVADYRYLKQFVTIDYSEATPVLFVGEAVTLSELRCELLRDVDTITDQSGNLRGKVAALDCPHCGSPIRYVPGATTALVCPACHSTVDVAGATAEVLAVGQRVAAIALTLELGAQANIEGTSYSVMGALKRSSVDNSAHWTEYLLYAPIKGFLWLIETDDGWQRAGVEDIWPLAESPTSVVYEQRRFNLSDDYMARVDVAIGAFNWQVAQGETVRVLEYGTPNEQLAGEISASEMTWSRARRVPLDQVRAWFGQHVHVESQPHPSYRKSAINFLILLAILDFLPALLGGGKGFVLVLLTAAFIYLPALFLDKFEGDAP